MARRPLWPAVLTGWAIASAMLLLVGAPAIAGLRFPDPDDAMRLLEVRDWLAGQSFWDVAQHRLNRGNFPMHWSRLVDLPLTAVMALADPLLGTELSTRLAMTLVPLLTLLAAMSLVAAITRQIAGDEPARLAVLLVPLSAVVVFQLQPLRIDHHGWQIVLALVATRLLLGRWTARNGALAGLALAALVIISLEGLPIAVVIAGVAALAWGFDPRRPHFVASLGASLSGGALLLHVLTRGAGAWSPACDAISPAWLGVLGTAGATLAVTPLASRLPLAARLSLLGAGGLASLLVLLVAGHDCLAGPFATLDPLVRALWYDQVNEGLPLWRQQPVTAAMMIGLPICGIVGTGRALGSAAGIARRRWALLAAVLLPAFALAVFVYRAGATANALAVPGAAVLAVELLHRARAIPTAGRRVVATAGVLLLVSPGVAAGGVAAALTSRMTEARAATAASAGSAECTRFADIRGLAALPATVVFAPVDVTPDLIATTHHRAVAGGYHRAGAAIHVVEAAFTSDPDRARDLVYATGARVLAMCPGLNEPRLYEHVAPNGLWARLARGDRVDWLQPIPIPGSPVRAWRVVPAHPLPVSARRT